MLGPIRKFSSSIFAKILLIIIIIPFVFWGMGSSFVGGNKNIIVKIDNAKYTIQEFSTYVQNNVKKKVNINQIEELLSKFIGQKLIEKEFDNLNIKLSDVSLSNLVKNQKNFKRNNKFSRVEYQKFLLKNNITAFTFELILSQEEKKKQLFDIIGGGILPSKFLVNNSYNRINQKRFIEFIDLNKIFQKKLNFTEDQVIDFFENNNEKFIEVYRSIKLLELNPKNLTNNNEFNDLFFKKIDEIDNLIITGKNLGSITKKFNLSNVNKLMINKFGKSLKSGDVENISQNLINKIFNLNNSEPTVLFEDSNKYFIIEFIKSENVKRKIEDELVKKEILLNLERNIKGKLLAEIIDKINKNNFSKIDFDRLAKREKIDTVKAKLENKNDNKVLESEIVNQIYSFPEKEVIVVNDVGLIKNYLIYIDRAENVTISENSEDYQKYLSLAKIKMVTELYNTYDSYLKKKYKIDVNYKTLDTVKNLFN